MGWFGIRWSAEMEVGWRKKVKEESKGGGEGWAEGKERTSQSQLFSGSKWNPEKLNHLTSVFMLAINLGDSLSGG